MQHKHAVAVVQVGVVAPLTVHCACTTHDVGSVTSSHTAVTPGVGQVDPQLAALWWTTIDQDKAHSRKAGGSGVSAAGGRHSGTRLLFYYKLDHQCMLENLSSS